MKSSTEWWEATECLVLTMSRICRIFAVLQKRRLGGVPQQRLGHAIQQLKMIGTKVTLYQREPSLSLIGGK